MFNLDVLEIALFVYGITFVIGGIIGFGIGAWFF